jgi:hypothetical protein
MAHHWSKKLKNRLVGRHDKDASSSGGLGLLTRDEKESLAAEECFWELCFEDKIWLDKDLEDCDKTQCQETMEENIIKESTKRVAVHLRTRDTLF